MQYQLVLQFPEKLINFDDLVRMEDDFLQLLKDDEIDGHDIGSGEINYFILTNKPEKAFNSLKQYLIDKEFLNCIKVGYRRIDEKKYTILHPSSLKIFDVK